MRTSSDTGEAIMSVAEQCQYDELTTELNKVHQVYRDVAKAFADSCIKNRVLITRKQMDIAIEGVGEALADEADDSIRGLADMGFTDFSYIPHDFKLILDDAHERIVDEFRPRKINADIVPALRPFTTNPQTAKDKGEPL